MTMTKTTVTASDDLFYWEIWERNEDNLDMELGLWIFATNIKIGLFLFIEVKRLDSAMGLWVFLV